MRDKLGRFTKGNPYAFREKHTTARKGWQGLVEKRFAGDVAAARAWVSAIGAWAYDTPYREAGMPSMPHPGSPEEFLQRHRETAEGITPDGVTD